MMLVWIGLYKKYVITANEKSWKLLLTLGVNLLLFAKYFITIMVLVWSRSDKVGCQFNGCEGIS